MNDATILWPHVVAVSLKEAPHDPKRLAFDLYYRNRSNCFQVLTSDEADRLVRRTAGAAVVLVGMSDRPGRQGAVWWRDRVGGATACALDGGEVWDHEGLLRARQVAPSLHPMPLDAGQQSLWDLAVAGGHTRRITARNPLRVAETLTQVGCTTSARALSHSLDGHVTRYDATIDTSGWLHPRSMVSIGRHRMFSGLLVPNA